MTANPLVRPRLRRSAAAAWLVTGLLGAITVAAATWSGLTQYSGCKPGAVVAGVAIAAAAVGVAWAILRGRRHGSGVVAWLVLLALLLAVGGSLVFGRITWARFGFTLYGVVPVPLLDLTVDARGLPWIRDKTHLATVTELLALRPEPDTDVVIGIGWHSQVVLAPDVRARVPGTLHVLPTPAAIERYNALRAAGRKVVLLLHSTC